MFWKRKRCCECQRTTGLLIQWCEPTQHVCPSCAWGLGYPEFCYESCKVR